jgi:hypothetical protein
MALKGAPVLEHQLVVEIRLDDGMGASARDLGHFGSQHRVRSRLDGAAVSINDISPAYF